MRLLHLYRTSSEGIIAPQSTSSSSGSKGGEKKDDTTVTITQQITREVTIVYGYDSDSPGSRDG